MYIIRLPHQVSPCLSWFEKQWDYPYCPRSWNACLMCSRWSAHPRDAELQPYIDHGDLRLLVQLMPGMFFLPRSHNSKGWHWNFKKPQYHQPGHLNPDTFALQSKSNKLFGAKATGTMLCTCQVCCYVFPRLPIPVVSRVQNHQMSSCHHKAKAACLPLQDEKTEKKTL